MKVEVTFQGVCAFVPDQPFFVRKKGKWEPGKPTRVTVSFPDLRTPKVVTTGGESHVRLPHYTILEYPEKWRRPSSREPHILRNDRAVTILTRERIEFSRSTSPFNPILIVPEKNPNEPNQREEPSLWWIPRMVDISRPHQEIGSGLVGQAFFSQQIASEISISFGELRVLDFNRFPNSKRKVPWPFVSRSSGGSAMVILRRVIGNKILWTFDVPGDSLAIVASFLFEGATDPTQFVLDRPLGSTETLKLGIKNVELEDAFDDIPALKLKTRFTVDPDFDVFYDLAGAAGPRPLPDKSFIAPKFAALGDSAKPCAPVAFER